MNVEQLIAKLHNYNPKAEVNVIVHNQIEDFTISFGGGSEGETKETCKEVSFYVDRLCQSDDAEG
ncbi:MAG TPA: hypothetical protein ENH85_00385 [Candidatus Scalindua sp.]|nr:hypothetical protein [Candidatus Scalindua sp.]